MTGPRPAAEDGIGLIEVLVAALVVVLAFTAMATIFISGQNQASADVQESQLINMADQEIEQVRAAVTATGFDSLGMSAAPTVLSDRVVQNTFFDPDNFVVAGNGVKCLLIATNYDSVTTTAGSETPAYGISAPSGLVQWSACNSTSTTSTDAEPLQIMSSGTPIISWSSTVSQCSSGSGGLSVPCWLPLTPNCSTTATDVTGLPSCAVTVYAFVSDTYVGCGTSGGTASDGTACPTVSSNVVDCAAADLPNSTSQSSTCGDARRLIIAVVPNPPDQTNATASHALARVTPVYLSTIFTNPLPSGSSADGTGLDLNLSVL